MALWSEIARRAAWLFRRSEFDRELTAEIRFHLEMRAEELEQEGMPHAEALAQARREFGPGLRAREETRAAWQFRWLEDLSTDLHYAARAFRRNPAFALTAICCLALGTGANTTMFSIAMEVLFSEPSCRDPRSLAQIRMGGESYSHIEEYRFLRDAHIFDGLAGMNIGTVVNWRDGSSSYRVAGTQVTSNFFEVTGVPVAIGRPFQTGETDAAVVTHGFWMARLGGEPDIVGRRLVLDGKPYTVVGVLPRDHRNLAGFGFMPDLYLTLESSEYLLYARLPRGTSPGAARGRLEVLCRELDRVYPSRGPKRAENVVIHGVGGLERLRAEAGERWVGGWLGRAAAFFGMLILVTGLVLLIACANVSSLLVARALSRSRELAIRASLGAGRGRVVRQLLAESLLLAACGTGAGLLINLALTRLLSGVRMPLAIPIVFLIEPDVRLLAYSMGVAVVVTLAAGLLPALKGTRAGLSDVLKQHEHQVRGGRWSFRDVLVVGQLAISIVLLSGGILFVRNLLRATSADPGFDAAHTVWATFRAEPAACTPERFRVLTRVAVERLGTLAGVDAATTARAVPMSMPFRRGGEFLTDASDRAIRAEYNYNAVGTDYFRTMRIPILGGRAFLDSDRAAAPAVVILNENLARLLFGNADAVGRTVRLPNKREVRVVGVARNSKYSLLGDDHPLALYRPFAQDQEEVRFVHLLVRAKGAPQGIVRDVERTLAGLDPAVAVETKTMRDALAVTLLPSRVGAGVLGGMALLGLALASIGLYGVLLYAVSRRIREIGLRVALGATPGNILGMVAGESARLVGMGVAIGLGVSVFAVRPLAMFLVAGLRATDPLNFTLVACSLAFVATLATVSPVIRALRVDPAEALRHE